MRQEDTTRHAHLGDARGGLPALRGIGTGRPKKRRPLLYYPSPARIRRANHDVPWDYRHHVVVPNVGLHVNNRNFFDRPTLLSDGTALSPGNTQRVWADAMQRTRGLQISLMHATMDDRLNVGLPLSTNPQVAPASGMGFAAGRSRGQTFKAARKAFTGCFRSTYTFQEMGR